MNTVLHSPSIRENSLVPKANKLISEAEQAQAERRWDESIQLRKEAASLLLTAVNQTYNLDTINALKLLASDQINKANGLEKYASFIKTKLQESPPKEETVVGIKKTNSLPQLKSSSIPINPKQKYTQPEIEEDEDKDLYDPMLSSFVQGSYGERPLGISDSVNEFYKFYSSPYGPLRRGYSEPELNPKSCDGGLSNVWNWMETLLQEFFPTVFSDSSEDCTNDLIESFVVLDEKEVDNLNPNSLLKKVQLQEQEILLLKEKIHQLEMENRLLKQEKYSQVSVQESELLKENEALKKSIFQFKQEIHKRVDEFRKSPPSSRKNLSASVPNFLSSRTS